MLSAIETALFAFACLFGSALLGNTIARALPEHHLNDDSKKAIERGLAIIGTVAGLVLGLLVASATASYNTQRGYVIQLASQIGLLDRALAHYGPEAAPVRTSLKATAIRVENDIWPPPGTAPNYAPGNEKNEELFDQLEALSPRTPAQTSIKGIAIGTAVDIGKTRWQMYEQLDSAISTPLLVMLIFWFSVTFLGIGLFAPRNATTLTGVGLCAVAIALAICVLLGMYRPFEGVFAIPSTPLRDTISRLGT